VGNEASFPHKHFHWSSFSHLLQEREGVKIDTVMDQTAWPSQMGPIGCPETSATNYQPTPCNIKTFNFVNSHTVTISSTKCSEMADVIYSTMFMFGMYVDQNPASTGCLCFRFSPESFSVCCSFQATVMWHQANTVNNWTPLPYKLIYESKYPVHTFVPILHLYC